MTRLALSASLFVVLAGTMGFAAKAVAQPAAQTPASQTEAVGSADSGAAADAPSTIASSTDATAQVGDPYRSPTDTSSPPESYVEPTTSTEAPAPGSLASSEAEYRNSADAGAGPPTWLAWLALGTSFAALAAALWALRRREPPISEARIIQLESSIKALQRVSNNEPAARTQTLRPAVPSPHMPNQAPRPKEASQFHLEPQSAPSGLVQSAGGVPVVSNAGFEAAVVASWNRLTASPSHESRMAFMREYQIDTLDSALAQSPSETFWWVSFRDDSLNGLILPGWAPIRDWSKHYLGPTGQAARTELEVCYDVPDTGSLSVEEPAHGRLEGEQIVVFRRGRLAGSGRSS